MPYNWDDLTPGVKSAVQALISGSPGVDFVFRPMVEAYSTHNGYGVEYNGAPFALPQGAFVAFDTGYVGDVNVTSELPAENDTVALDTDGVTVKRTGLFNAWFEVDFSAALTKPCKIVIPGSFAGAEYWLPAGVTGHQTGFITFQSPGVTTQPLSMILGGNAADSGINVVYAALTVNEILTGQQG